MWPKGLHRLAAPAVAGVVLFMSSCSGSSTQQPAPQPPQTPPAAASSKPPSGTNAQAPVPAQKPVPPENNPPGDIPDDTAFVPYRSHDGRFSIKVPEGWARHTRHTGVTFSEKLNTIDASWSSASAAPTTSSAKKTEVPQLQQTQLAFRLTSVKSVKLPGGNAVLITSEENSPANGVTGKQYRLDVLRYEYFSNGAEAVLTLSSPVGADNVDPWNLVSQSFRWA